MPRRLECLVIVACLVSLGACAQGTVQDALGMGKRSPDEFAVVTRAPLIMPPDYGLRPPRPGESRPGVDTPTEQARASLLGQPADAVRDGDPQVVTAAFDEAASGLSEGEQALVSSASTTPRDPEIRQKLAAENLQLAEVEQALFTRLVKWKQPASLGTTIDAPAESERLLTNRAEGRPVTAGESPVIVQRRHSALKGFLKEAF